MIEIFFLLQVATIIIYFWNAYELMLADASKPQSQLTEGIVQEIWFERWDAINERNKYNE